LATSPDPATETTPPPTAPEPSEPDRGGAGSESGAGAFTLPGLEGLPIPLPAPQGSYDAPEPPARGSLAAAPAGSTDANGFMTRAFLEQETEAVHQALIAALDEHEEGQVRGIPLSVVQEHHEPNAAAGCTNGRHAVMMITTAMLEVAAGIAETKAYDELAGTDTYETYVTHVVELVRNDRRMEGVDASLHSAPHATDPHKLARQRHLFDQQVAFILGHELAHHYRGHTNCVEGRTEAEIERDQLSQLLAHTVPPFSQPREVEADMWGVTNVLEAGHGREGGTWTEEGAMLNLDFFRRVSDHGGAELVMAFLSTHPPSVLRIPIVRSTTQQWNPGWRPPRMPVPGEGGGQGVELPTPGGPIHLPDPSQLPVDPSRLPIPLPRPR
ncbi:MAG TPA: M48 family metalloprotease, partial [Sandaracinaceae bacterium LLY-WYZ-13_1]|nr:M48 family metalloprotease [Sandaracinaceae bacterium LLY-WYZ-13_1]